MFPYRGDPQPVAEKIVRALYERRDSQGGTLHPWCEMTSHEILDDICRELLTLNME